MDNNMTTEDIDSSFELFEPMVPSMPHSMSIVIIPEDKATNDDVFDGHHYNAVPSHPSESFDEMVNDFNTRRMDSIENSLPDYNQLEGQELLSQKLSNIYDQSVAEERNASLQTLADNLDKIEVKDEVKKCSNNFDEVLASKDWVKEVKDECERQKSKFEEFNAFLKQQIQTLQTKTTDSMVKNNEMVVEHKRVVEAYDLLCDENKCLKEDNCKLNDRVKEMDVSFGSLSEEVVRLRDRCQQMANYEKLNIPSELRSQEVSSQLVSSQLTIDAMGVEINGLKNALFAANERVDSMPAMVAQLALFEHDFKVEELAKTAAFKEVEELEKEVERLKARNSHLEGQLEKVNPVVDVKAKPEPVGRHHHRRHRGRLERLGRNSIPVLNVSTVLKGFKQYRTTSNDV